MQSVTKRIVMKQNSASELDSYQEALEKPSSACCPATGLKFAEANQWCYGNPFGPKRTLGEGSN